MRRIFNKTLASKILVQLAIILFCILKATAQPQSESFVQKLDDRVMMDIQKTHTPENADFMLFMSSTYRYGDIGIPAAMLVCGVVGHNEALRQNSLDVAGSTAISYAAMALIKGLNKAAKALCAKHQYRSGLRAGSYSFPSGIRNLRSLPQPRSLLHIQNGILLRHPFCGRALYHIRVCTWGCITHLMSVPD